MRSTLEIIIAVKDCQPVTEEELKLALVALSNIEHFVRHELQGLVEAVVQEERTAKFRAQCAEGLIERMFNAMKKPPDKWLGPGNIPGTPENRERMRWAKAVYKKATGEEL